MEEIKTLISEKDLQKRILELADEINKDYEGKTITVLCLLKGAAFFATDLVKRLKPNVVMEFVQLSSYEGENSTGKVDIKRSIEKEKVEGKDILIAEDIIDTGITMNFLLDYLSKMNAKSVKVATLLSKEERRQKKVQIDYLGFEIPNKFVLGYGMDYDQLYRNLPYIGYIEK